MTLEGGTCHVAAVKLQLFPRIAACGLLLAIAAAQPADAQVVNPTPSPLGQLMPFTADAYPQVSNVAGGPPVFKTAVLAASGQEVLAERLLVKFLPTTSDAARIDVHSQAAKRVSMAARPVGQLNATTYLVDVSGATLEAAAGAYRADARVAGVGIDSISQLDETPNDPNFGSQWGMAKIQAPAAWNRTHGGGGGGTIAILDSGIDDTHPDFAGKVSHKKNFTGASSGTADINGHGTHVAGIVGAATNNSQSVAGVAYETWFLNGKVADDSGKIPLSSLINGINWATEFGASVINMSLGATGTHFYDDCDPDFWEDALDIGVNELRDALGNAWSHGIVLVGTAGNKGTTFQQWPGSCPNVLSVANTDEGDNLASDSNRGTWVDVAAPGTHILSTATGGGVVSKSGTSMAAPHVSGLAALVRASCPWSGPQDIVNRITSTADPIAGTGSLFKFGRVNALDAVCFQRIGLRVGTITSTSIQVKWEDKTPVESRWELFYGPSGGALTSSIVLAPNTESWVHTNVAPGAVFDYQVRVCDGIGCSDLSNKLRAESNVRKLTVTRGGFGSVSGPGINCGADCSELYSYGTAVTLTAHDFINSRTGTYWFFDHWEGACSGAARSCTVSMSANRSAKAVFVDGSDQ
jgi:thermitase